MDAASVNSSFGAREQLRAGRQVLRQEAQALLQLAEALNDEFVRAVDLLDKCRGCVIVSGMGKAGLIGRKVVATLGSLGVRAHFLHPAEAVHGDLGRMHADDLALVLSQSGETEEVVRILPSMVRLGVPMIAVTCRPNSTLGQKATVTLDLGPLEEACHLGVAPSTSTTAMLALGDALALVLSRRRDFSAEDFALYHPAGNLGRMLARVEDLMRPLGECRVAGEACTVREVLVSARGPGRRTGAIMITSGDGVLAGLFTDSDFARLFAHSQAGELDARLAGPISAVMTRRPTTVPLGTLVRDAVAILADRKFSELPVVDVAGRPVGLLDITDVVGIGSLLPHEAQAKASPAESAVSSQIHPPHDGAPPPTLPFANSPRSHRVGNKQDE